MKKEVRILFYINSGLNSACFAFILIAVTSRVLLSQTLKRTADFETGDFSQIYRVNRSDACGDTDGPCDCGVNISVRVVSKSDGHPVRSGSHSVYHRLINCHERAEMMVDRFPMNKALWAGWSLYVPKKYTDHYTILSQFHDTAGQNWCPGAGRGGPTALSMHNQGEKLNFKIRYKDLDGNCNRQFNTIVYDVDNMVGKWTDVVVHARLAEDNSGFMRLWIYEAGTIPPAQPTYELLDHSTTGSDHGAAWRIGIYRGNPGHVTGYPEIVIYSDEARWGLVSEGIDFGHVAPDGVSPYAANSNTGVAWPLRVSANNRYLEDQNGKPFYIQTESAWKAYNLSPSEQDLYLDDLLAKGINSFQMWGPTSSNPGDSWYIKADQLVGKARTRDILVFVCMTQGKKPKTQYNKTTAFVHGRMMARRFSAANHLDNVVFISGFDTLDTDLRWEQMALGVKDENPRSLVTFHSSRGHSSVENWGVCKSWLDLNGIYTHHPPWWRKGNPYPYEETWANWNKYGHCMPLFEIEAVYEDEHNPAGSERNMRKQHWWIISSGNIAGHAYGHRLIWSMRPGWQTEGLNAAFRKQLIHIKNFLESFAWWKLVPDADDNLVLVGNKGAGETRVTASLSEDGSLAIVYTPEGIDPTLNLSKFSANVYAKWYDTSEGFYRSTEGPFANSGDRIFETPDNTDDWALLITTNP